MSATADLPTVGLAGSFTTQPVGDALEKLGRTVQHADYNQIHTTCLDPASAFEEAIEHLAVLWRVEDVFEADLIALLNGDDAAGARIVDQSRELAQLACSVPENHGLGVTLGLPPYPTGLGIDPLDTSTSIVLSDVMAHVRRATIDQAASQSAVRLFDLGRLLDARGLDKTYDGRNQLLYRQPYRRALVDEMASELLAVINSASIAAPKVLALDADNTLWGGIVGEDGISGIAIGGTFPGNAFREFQLAVKALERRGIMLAIVSKNDAAAVDEVFEDREEMVLTKADIAAWRVNWTNKSTNLKEIADELNIGLDSIVFVDDSDFEVEEVRTALPMVRIIQVPEDPEDIPGILAESGLFRNLSATAEDGARTAMMQTEQKRTAAAEVLSHEEFLASLELQVTIDVDEEQSLGRITQLINKTNQFNLTTVRRSEAEVQALMRSDDHRVYSASVSDRFGSYGLVGVAIVDAHDPDAHEVDSLLMSCRVLRRGVESSILNVVCGNAHDEGAQRIRGRFEPTAKNSQVAELYPEHGFATSNEEGVFELEFPEVPAAPEHIDLVLPEAAGSKDQA